MRSIGRVGMSEASTSARQLALQPHQTPPPGRCATTLPMKGRDAGGPQLSPASFSR
jgi:hypothetical protein